MNVERKTENESKKKFEGQREDKIAERHADKPMKDD
jgi:hypothetical protein